jgi:phosphohistidine phosphatase
VKRLLILRHAKSSWANSSISDWQRPLNERGLRDAPRAGEWLRERALTPDLILTSDAVRARTTAEAVARAAGYSQEIRIEPSLYHARPDDVLAVLGGVSAEARTVLVVGHNPGLEELVQQLTGEHHDLPTAALVHIAMAIAVWSDVTTVSAAAIVDIWRPRDS